MSGNSVEERVNRWIRPAIRELSAYAVPNAEGFVKLDAMENPWPWPGELQDAWLDALRHLRLNRYPDPRATRLVSALREAMALPQGSGVLLGNGSDELIQMIAMALAGPGRCVMAPEPGFVMYRMIATFVGMEYVGVPLRENFGLDEAAMLEAIERHRPAVIFLAYPNNPTGNLFDEGAMRRIIRAAPGLVVVDEAYHAFAEASFLGDLESHPNLLVMRTLSKLGLAGLRLGLLVGAEPWIREFDKVRLPYNINALTQASAEFALRHRERLEIQAARIRAERERLMAELEAIPWVKPCPSRANFILFRVPEGAGEPVFEQLLGRRILIKNLGAAGGMLRDCLRVTVGMPEENRLFVQALKAVKIGS